MIADLVLLLLTAILLAIYAGIFRAFRKGNFLCVNNLLRDCENATRSGKISVVIAAHNEEDNIEKLLTALSKQSEKHCEIILVCDRCDDQTEEKAKKFVGRLPLKILAVSHKEEAEDGKKNALRTGIRAAEGQIIALTDADCVPRSPLWLESLCQSLRDKSADVVVGVSPYFPVENCFGQFVLYENLKVMADYILLAFCGFPYMCVGRNWAFTKKIFEKAGGYDDLMHITGGDDDLLLQKMSRTGAKIAAVTDKQAQVLTDAKSNYRAWFGQKKRHLGAGFRYGLSEKISAQAINFFEMLWLLQVLFVTLHSKSCVLVLLLAFLRVLVKSLVFNYISKICGTNFKARLLPFFEIFFAIYLLFVGMFSKFSGVKKWN